MAQGRIMIVDDDDRAREFLNAFLLYKGHQVVQTGDVAEALRAIERNAWLRAGLGTNGRRFYRQHYDWPVIDRKYLEMLERLRSEPPRTLMDPLPDGEARRAADLLAHRCSARSSCAPPWPSVPAYLA